MKKTVFLPWLMLWCVALPGQPLVVPDTATITGVVKVIDEDNNPLLGVSVFLNNQPYATTDFAGAFNYLAQLNDTLSFEYLGYRSSKVPVTPAMPRSVQLSPEATLIPTIAVIGRRNEDPKELPYRVEVIDQRSIQFLQSPSTADALADLSGIYVQKSQFGGGSPVVRGFEANRVLLVVDGVRMNNAIFRNGHLQNAITVDVNALNQMELIYGPGSLAYGSDALGGVIHFRTHQPAWQPSPQWRVNAAINYATAAKATTLSGGLEYGNKRFASYTQISLKDFNDLRAGDQRPADFPNFGQRNTYQQRIDGLDTSLVNTNPNLQIGSGYQQIDLLQKLRWRPKKHLTVSGNFQLSTSSNVPRYDNLTEFVNGQFRWAQWDYGPQNRLLGSIRLNSTQATKLFDSYSIIISHQFIEEDRLIRRSNFPLREHNEVDVNSTNLQLDFKRYFSEKQRLTYGIDARYDRVESNAFLRDVNTEARLPISVASRYPSAGSSLTTSGAYLDYQYQFHPNWTAQSGIRVNYQWLGATFGANDPIEWPANYLSGITNTAGAITAAASIRYRKADHNLRLILSQGFRAPNIDDYAKFRERNGFIQVPNPDLGNERSNSIELGYELDQGGWQLSTSFYHTWLSNAIVRSNFRLPDGRSSFISFGDTLSVQANINAESARIYGFDVGLRRALGRHWLIAGELHWLRGRRKQNAPNGQQLTLPQDHIPPMYGNLVTSYQANKWQVMLRWRFQAAKAVEDYAVGAIIPSQEGLILDRRGTSDNLELTPIDPETGNFSGTYAWSTFNLNTSLQLNERLKVTAGIENIFDLHYRTFASGISAPGRNFMVGIVWR
ncbi:MAG: TonB-dependent receptor [Bacteroidota bacterium]